MIKTLLSTLAVGLLLAGSPLASSRLAKAQEAEKGAKPVLVVAVNSLEELLADVDFLGTLTDNKEITDMGKARIGAFLKGIDQKKPSGVVVSTDGSEFRALGFIPVTSLKDVLETLGGFGIEVADAGDGVKQLTGPSPKPVYVKENGGYAFISDKAESLADLPKDPEKLLDGLTKDYDVAVRGYLKNVPDLYRKLAITSLQSGVEFGMPRLPGESAEDFAFRKDLIRGQIKNLVQVMNDLDQITFGAAIDSKGSRTYVDFTLTATADSKTAKQMAELKSTTSEFAGFLMSDAAATFNFSSKVSKEDVEASAVMFKALREKMLKEIEGDGRLPDEGARKAVKELVDELFEAASKTVASGKMDGGAALVLNSGALTVVAGAHVADGPTLDKTFQKFIKLAESDPSFPKDALKLNAASHKGVSFHTLNVPVPDEQAAKVLGETLDVAIGFGKTSVYVGFGKDCIKTLQSAIDKSEASASTTVPPAQINVSVGQIVKFAASVEGDPITAMIAKEAEKLGGKDHVKVEVRGVTNGAGYRIELEEGLLKLIGLAAKMKAEARRGF